MLLVVSATLPSNSATCEGPRKDYVVTAEALHADLLDRSAVQNGPRAAKLLGRINVPVAQAWLAFRRRSSYQAILTDGEHIGIPLGVLLKIARAKTTHVTIGHRITAAKKRPFFRWLRVQTHIARIVVHARRQYELAREDLGIQPDQLALIPYQVDTEFWRPLPHISEERLVCSAGLEFRDYPTLEHALAGLDVKLVIGAASHWSKRRNTAAGMDRQTNVEVGRFDYSALRHLYARSAVVVVPLDDIDFQAGVTTILEAMAMAKPVVVTHTRGQTDVVEDRRRETRGAHPRTRTVSLVREIAERSGIRVEPNGFYVLPGDAAALRRAIKYLLDHPQERYRLGHAGRRTVERLMTVEQFADRIKSVVYQACSTPKVPPNSAVALGASG